MKLPKQPRTPPITDPVDAAAVNKQIRLIWEEISRVVNGLIWFGSVADGRQNMDGVTLNTNTPGGADTNFTLTHNLGRVPVGFIVVNQDKGAVTYRGTVTWTETQLTLKCNTATVNLTIFVF